MVDSKGSKRRWLDVVLQEQEDLEGDSEVILDQEPPSEYASRVPIDQRELRKRQRVPLPDRPMLNVNIFRFDHIPQDNPSFNPAAASLPSNRLEPSSNLSANPSFLHQILPEPVRSGPQQFAPFTAATNATPGLSPHRYSFGEPSPHTGLSQPARPHPYPSNMIPATSQNEGSHRTPHRTPPPNTQVVPQYTYANMQAPIAQATWLGSVLQSPDHSIHQPRPRAVSMPYVLSFRPSSSPESQAAGAVADTDAQPLTPQNADPTFPRAQSSSPQNADPTFPRAQSSSPLQSAGPNRQRAQSSPLSIRGGVLWTAAPTPYQNGQLPVQNTPLPSQNGHVQNRQPYDHNRLASFQNYPTTTPNFSLPFNNNQLPSHQNGVPASIPHFESGSGLAGQPSIPSAQPAPVSTVLAWLSMQEQLFSPLSELCVTYTGLGDPLTPWVYSYYASGGKPAVAPTPVEDKSLANLSNLFEKYRGMTKATIIEVSHNTF